MQDTASSEPAQIITSGAEQQCIRIAQELRLDSIKAELQDLSISSIEFMCPLAELTSDMKWLPSFWGKFLQVVLIPVAFLLFIILVAPVIYLHGVWGILQKRKKLTKLFREIECGLESQFDTPDEKTLHALWRCYGLGKDVFTEKEQLHLLSRWIEILYGETTRQRFNFKQLIVEIGKRQIRANTPYYKGEPDAPNFFFTDLAFSLAITISDALPRYDMSSEQALGKPVGAESGHHGVNRSALA